ncbi:DUF6112 family protein [Brevibacterium luteolum]|uniref:DUF6112 family protein n=1 Tax=Brevibacterium luteolum TaxID=199591 RepID=UPI003B66BCA2
MNVFPDFEGLSGITELREIVGALLMFVLVVAVLMLIVSGIIWGIASSHGNQASAAKGRTGVLVCLGAAILAGGAMTWMNWLIDLGEQF